MKLQRMTTAAVPVLMLTACGLAVHGTPAASTASTPPPGTAAPVVTGWPLTLNIDLTRPVHQVIDVDCAHWAGPPNLSVAVGRARAVAVVTVDGMQAARWNTVDGARPTQADALAALRASNGRIAPMLWTGWSMHVSGPVLRGTVPAAITAYVQGGQLGQDDIDIGTCMTSRLRSGGTFLAVFGGEIDQQSSAVLRAPMLQDLMAYDPATGMVTAPGGAVRLPSSLPPPGQ